MINLAQFRSQIIVPTLTRMDMMSESAANLMLGTALVESGLQYIKQIGAGPALGVYQVEPSTLRDIYENYLPRKPEIKSTLNKFVHWNESFSRDWDYLESHLMANLIYGTAVARLIYWRRPEALPVADDVDGMANYWKRFYNSWKGKGSVEDYVRAWEKRK